MGQTLFDQSVNFAEHWPNNAELEADEPYSDFADLADEIFEKRTRKHNYLLEHCRLTTEQIPEVKCISHDFFWPDSKHTFFDLNFLDHGDVEKCSEKSIEPLEMKSSFDIVRGDLFHIQHAALTWLDMLARQSTGQQFAAMFAPAVAPDASAKRVEDSARDRYLELKALERSGRVTPQQSEELLRLEEAFDADDENDPIFIANAAELRRDNERLGIILEMESLLDRLRGYRAEVREKTNSSSI